METLTIDVFAKKTASNPGFKSILAILTASLIALLNLFRSTASLAILVETIKANLAWVIVFPLKKRYSKICGLENLPLFLNSIKILCSGKPKFFSKHLKNYETVSFFLPLSLLLLSTCLPFFVSILVLKPCFLILFVLLGWYVRFVLISTISIPSIKCSHKGRQKRLVLLIIVYFILTIT